MKKLFKFKKEKVIPIVGLIFIFLGLMVFSGGKPDELDPNILNPIWESMLVGALFMFVGWWIGRKHFKNFLDDADIQGIQYNLIESYR